MLCDIDRVMYIIQLSLSVLFLLFPKLINFGFNIKFFLEIKLLYDLFGAEWTYCVLIPDKLTHWRYAVFTQYIMKQYIMYWSSTSSYACLD